jgi:glycosyltransferase involved in cell wall biosynthesis
MQDSLPQPLRVAVVVASQRIVGGHSVQARLLLDAWRKDGSVDPWIVPIDPVPPAPLDRLLRIKYVRTIVTQLWYWPLLVRELRRADVVHAFAASYASFLLAPLPAVLIARLLGKPVVLNYHSGEASDHLRRSIVARFVLRRLVDVNVVQSAFLRDVFRSFDIDAQVVPNIVDLRQFTYRPRSPLRPRLLCTRNFEPLYNLSCVLRALAKIQALYPAATLTLVGSGSQERMLRQEATALGLENVTFAGRIAPSHVHAYYANADIYVQAPTVDNMPLSLLEAFASGLPVVSTDVGGVPSMLRHGVDGLLVADNDADALADQIVKLLTDDALARRLAESAHRTLAAYQWPVVREGWLQAYRRALGQIGQQPSEHAIESAPLNPA